MVLVFIKSWQNIKEINFAEVFLQVRSLGTLITTGLFLLAVVAVLQMGLYDFIIIKRFSYKLKLRKILKISWISNTFNNFLGFAGIIGAGTRSLLYFKNGIKKSDSIKMSIIILSSTVSGLSVMSVLAVLITLNGSYGRLVSSENLLLAELLLVSTFLPIYFFYQRIPLFNRYIFSSVDSEIYTVELRVKLLLASVIEWFVAFLLFYSISLCFNVHLPIIEVFIIFVTAAGGGVISLVPGGVGSFDLIAVSGFSSTGIDSTTATSIILVYRLLYFVIPWFFGLIFLSIEYSYGSNAVVNVPKVIKNFWNYTLESTILGDIGVKALSILVFLSGFILLLSASFPGVQHRLIKISGIVAQPVMIFSHRVSIVLGIMLIVLSYGINKKVKRAHSFTLILLVLGALFTFVKGMDFEEATILLGIAFLLWILRKTFYRESADFPTKVIIVNVIVTATLLIFYANTANYLNNFLYAHKHLKVHLFPVSGQFFKNASYAFIVSWSLILLYMSLRPKRPFDKLSSEEDFTMLSELLKKYSGNTLVHLAYTGDKNFFWSKDKSVLVIYGNISGYLVALGDPIGNSELFKATIEEFQSFADKYSMKTAFYQIVEHNFSLYHSNGYRFIKLGEEAVVNLTKFNLVGKKMQDFRTVLNKFKKINILFEEVHNPVDANILSEIASVSKEWLANRKEKGFSIGRFSADYISKSRLFIARNNSGKIIAFTTVIPVYDGNKTVSVDLMRMLKGSPNGIMDFMFVNIISWARENGYKYFNLGMAPLSNVGSSRYAHEYEKIVKIIFKYGNTWYKFSGLRRYKEKYQPDWHPKYLAYYRTGSPYNVLIQIARLISSSGRK